MTTDRDDMDLDTLLRAARRSEIPGDDLVARVLADAASVQADRATSMATSTAPGAPVQRGGWFSGVVQAIGGWPAVSGMTAAALTGLAVGFGAPDLVDSWSGGHIWTLSGGGGTVPEIGALWDGTWEEMGDV